MADQLLDRDKYPEYHGTRTKLLTRFPDRMDLWEQYDDVRRIDLAGGGDGKTMPSKFFAENMDAMKDGSVVAWPHLNIDYGLSVLHYCMHKFLEDPAAFFAEDQNEPQIQSDEDEQLLTKDDIAKLANVYEQGIAPASAEIITGHVDVQLHCLFYAIVAWKDDATGYVLEYGTWPKQRARHFEYKKISNTLEKAYPGLSREARIRKAVAELTNDLCGRDWKSDDGTTKRVKRLLVDCNWMTDEVYTECRESEHRGILMPARGKFVGAGTMELNENQKKAAGKKLGLHWRVEKSNRMPIKSCTFDTNYWKSWIHNRYATDPKERGSLTLFKAPARDHVTFAAHQCGEYPIRTEGRGRIVYEWKGRPGRPDNHWFDNIVGAAVAASIEGIQLRATGPAPERPKRKRRDKVQYL